jgi:hypothetical protein
VGSLGMCSFLPGDKCPIVLGIGHISLRTCGFHENLAVCESGRLALFQCPPDPIPKHPKLRRLATEAPPPSVQIALPFSASGHGFRSMFVKAFIYFSINSLILLGLFLVI